MTGSIIDLAGIIKASARFPKFVIHGGTL